MGLLIVCYGTTVYVNPSYADIVVAPDDYGRNDEGKDPDEEGGSMTWT